MRREDKHWEKKKSKKHFDALPNRGKDEWAWGNVQHFRGKKCFFLLLKKKKKKKNQQQQLLPCE